ncbi:MAG: hypothetical protein WCA35_29865 [Kovacikia sp.]
MVTLCSATGVILGGTSSWAESNTCMQVETPSKECLTKNPALRTVEGMGVGLLAGMGAAIGATWQAKREN